MFPITAFTVVFLVNACWFGIAFWYFSITPDRAADLLVPKSERGSPLLSVVSASVRFLGGMNLALAVFAILILLNRALFPESRQIALFATVFSLAHATQFLFNLSIIFGGKRETRSLWPVLRAPMLFIFVIDFVLMLANGILAIAFTLTGSGSL